MSSTPSLPGWRAVTPALGLQPAADAAVDPYLLWAEASQYAGYPSRNEGDSALLPVLAELSGQPVDVHQQAVAAGQGEAFETLFGPAALLPTRPASRFQTLLVRRDGLAALVTLQGQGLLRRWQLGALRGTPAQVAGRALPPITGEGLVRIDTLGVVDDGCCLAHDDFRGPNGKSRFAFVWDQSPRARYAAPWVRLKAPPAGSLPAAYGGELAASDIEALLQAHPQRGEAGERRLYEALGRPDWGQSDRVHGVGVLHLLAGPKRPQLPEEETAPSRSRPIIFVQLPDQAVGDTSGGSIGFYVLDAVRYIVQRTRDLNGGDGWRSTINVSLGSLGGPHDGSSIVEQALDEIVTDHVEPGTDKLRVRIVLAAGNAAGRGLHGVRQVSAAQPGQFHVMVPPDNPLESFVELWPLLDGDVRLEDLHITVCPPGGEALQAAGVGSVRVLTDAQGQVLAGLVFPRVTAQSVGRPMVLLAVRPTRGADDSTPAAPYGAWTITVSSAARTPITVHGWVERNDTVIRRRSPQQTVFLDEVPAGEPGGWLSDDSTLSSLAHGEHTDCVGAYEVQGPSVAPYSSRGPVLNPERPRSLVHGASDTSASLPGIPVPGFYSGTRMRLSGTSAAAPRVARWIADGEHRTQLVDLAPDRTARPGPQSEPKVPAVRYVPEVDIP